MFIHFFNRYCHFLQKVTFLFLYKFRSVFGDFVFFLVHAFWLLFFQNYDLLIDFGVFLCFLNDFCDFLDFLGLKGPGPMAND